MSFIAWHPIFKHPLPKGHRFPMLKYELLHDQLIYEGVVEEEDFFQPPLLDVKFLKGVHCKSYWQRLLTLDLNSKEIRRIGFPLSKQLVERELHIAQGTVTAAERALDIGIGFNIAGGTHHAGSHWGEGFCLLNDQAIAARCLLDHHKLKQILIIDLDVHQGNGTAEIFENEKQVFTFSMHGNNNFPFKKERSDLDIGLADKTEGPEYLFVLKQHLDHLFKTEDCRERDSIIFNFCKKLKIPVQVSMGGGYSDAIKDIVNVHCQTFKEGISAVLY